MARNNYKDIDCIKVDIWQFGWQVIYLKFKMIAHYEMDWTITVHIWRLLTPKTPICMILSNTSKGSRRGKMGISSMHNLASGLLNRIAGSTIFQIRRQLSICELLHVCWLECAKAASLHKRYDWPDNQSCVSKMYLAVILTNEGLITFTHLLLDKMSAISPTIFLYALSLKILFCILIKTLFLRVQFIIISQHWYR